MDFHYIFYFLHIIIILCIISIPFHSRSLLKYTIFLPLIFYICHLLNDGKCIITSMHGPIDNRGFIQGLTHKLTGSNIPNKYLHIIQNAVLSIVTLLAGIKLSATHQDDDTYQFFNTLYNKMHRY
jgi:hypothetical protein